MRIAIVSPYSWTYAGGVNRHVESLASALAQRRHEVRVLAPFDPPDRRSRTLHRGVAPQRREPPDYLIPLGRTIGFPANGAVSNLSIFPDGVNTMRRELKAGRFDVVHVHEPVAPMLSWDACSFDAAPVVGTFHAYSTKPVPNRIGNLMGARRKFNQLHARIAVSEAAAWTGRRWFGGSYEVIPNGVDVAAAPPPAAPDGDRLRVLFVGRAEERKGLPVLLSAFEALVEHVPSTLTLVGIEPEEVRRYVHDLATLERIDALGRVGEDELWLELGEADVLAAPSLAGESFGMILTEAFAAGTPVIASNIAGYADVVTDGHDGVLVPPADAQRLAEELQRMYVEPARRERMAAAALESANRYDWPHVAARVEAVYERVQTSPAPVSAPEAIARRTGLIPIDGSPSRPPQRLPGLDPEPARAMAGARRVARRVGLGVAAIAGLGLTALAANKIGVANVISSIVRSDVNWVLIALGLMMAAMCLRAVSWLAIARAALPGRPIRRRDVTSATMIGVLMSATLPARVGEPARAMVLARRVGRMRETFPVLLGTLVSQTALNILALILLGVIIVSTTNLFHSSSMKLFIVSSVPLLALVAVALAPAVMRQAGRGRFARAAEAIRGALLRVRQGLRVFREPRKGGAAAAAQLGAWALQLSSCYALSFALGLEGRAGIGAAAAVLFAVNVTAVVPATPSNIGVFQLAVISVLTTGWGIGASDALAYGVILQAVEIATAVVLGLPALVREGLSWSDMRVRALSAAPVRLTPKARQAGDRVSS
jgi:phosphatidyl-myo-inositol alpha-mannosyltransferase